MTSGRTTMDAFEQETCKVILDGKVYTMTQYKKMLKAKKREENKDKPKKKEVKKTNDNFVADEINKIMKPITILKSLSAYYDHAYRQWGTIGKQLLENRHVRPHFVSYRITDIDKMKNERAVFQFIEKLVWKIEDIKELIAKIMDGAKRSGYLDAYKDHECISGKGRRLGLKTLSKKSLKGIGQMEDAMEKFKKIVTDGIDPLEYSSYISFNSKRRLGL